MTAAKKGPGAPSGATASRPYMPGYGVPATARGLLPWSHVSERMLHAHHYWICTADSAGRPHATPVDGLWLDDVLYFGGHPTTVRSRNLRRHSAACVHLESASDVVILQGRATVLEAPEPGLAARLVAASRQKYGYGPGPEDLVAGGVFAFRARTVFAWSRFPKDATRWRFD